MGLYWLLRRIETSRGAALTRRLLPSIACLALALGGTTAGLARFAPPPSTRASGAPDILLIVLDTVRADRLSIYGYERATTPELDAFALESIRFTNVFSTSSWTVPSHASLFTGLYPVEHGATQERVKLDSRFATLAEIFRDAGYQTWGASGNPWMSRAVNLAQGFETFVPTWVGDRRPRPEGVRHPANAAFEKFLLRRDPRRPFFAFINYMDAHTPYAPPEPYRSRYVHSGMNPDRVRELERAKWSEHYRTRPFDDQELGVLSDLYDASLAALSRDVGKLLQILEARRDPENTLIVLTSDHGEHFGENQIVGHMFGLYNTAVRVPLMIQLPGGERAGEVNVRKGQLIDLFVTLLDAAGVEFAAGSRQGFDLLDGRAAARGSVFSEYYYPDQVLEQFTPEERESRAEVLNPFRRRLRAVEKFGHRLIWSSDGQHELYNVSIDPGESRNLLLDENRTPASDEFLRLLEGELLAYIPEIEDPLPFDPDRTVDSLPKEIDAETLEALREVGYVR